MTLTPAQLRSVLGKHSVWKRYFELTGVDKSTASISRLVIHGSELLGADLQATDISHAHLNEADLRGTNLLYAELNGTQLQGADLRGAALEHANFYNANLQRADLRGAELAGTSFFTSDLRSAKLDQGFRDCYSFKDAKFTADALPWLILHPRWDEMRETVLITDE